MARKILLLKYGLPGALALLFLSGAVYYLFIQPEPSSLTTLETVVQPQDAGPAGVSTGTVLLSLFYPAPSALPDEPLLLKEEKKPVRRFSQPERQAMEVLRELSRPSPSGIPSALPPEALPLHVFFLEERLAVVDYSRKIQENLPGGMDAERTALYAIVHTVTFNFPQISAVRLLVEGKEQETLAGHFGIEGNLQADLSLIQDYQNPAGNIRVETLPP